MFKQSNILNNPFITFISFIGVFIALYLGISSCQFNSTSKIVPPENTSITSPDNILKTGAEQLELYLHLLKDKRVGLLVNTTSVIGKTHLVDTLQKLGVNIQLIFAPEHGFRGDADAGEHVASYTDPKTKLPVISLYGNNKKPAATDIAKIDVLIFDIQDVGVRFYTYLSSLYYAMESCSENNKLLLVLDRPNPNNHYVDGPVLDLKYKSFIGILPVPIVYGLTLGEMTGMINGEKWLKDSLHCKVKVIPLKNYTHTTFYHLDIKPSPNLPNDLSIRLYPSLGLFEGTKISMGRGTQQAFQIYGSPKSKGSYTFTPISIQGMAKNPPYENQLCMGVNLISNNISTDTLQTYRFTLKYIIDAINNYTPKEEFFIENNFFEKLAGNNQLRQQIKNGVSEADIRKTWEPDLSSYKSKRVKYLLYKDFE
ncbi:MAG: DUF1343 domain-containing protein [Cytophagaceae bacterium]